jgi:hypothetical protein
MYFVLHDLCLTISHDDSHSIIIKLFLSCLVSFAYGLTSRGFCSCVRHWSCVEHRSTATPQALAGLFSQNAGKLGARVERQVAMARRAVTEQDTDQHECDHVQAEPTRATIARSIESSRRAGGRGRWGAAPRAGASVRPLLPRVAWGTVLHSLLKKTGPGGLHSILQCCHGPHKWKTGSITRCPICIWCLRAQPW